jgi:hypothetical protein
MRCFHIHLWCPIIILGNAIGFLFVSAVQCVDATIPSKRYRSTLVVAYFEGCRDNARLREPETANLRMNVSKFQMGTFKWIGVILMLPNCRELAESGFCGGEWQVRCQRDATSQKNTSVIEYLEYVKAATIPNMTTAMRTKIGD